MSIIGLIVVGDTISHGGTVLTGDPTWTVDGIPVARVGNSVFCPLCQRTTVIVSSRFPTLTDNGMPAVPATSSGASPQFDEQIQFVDEKGLPLAGVEYVLYQDQTHVPFDSILHCNYA
jgi:uncharacterized Zn-binding protein involved in type VI secretion